MPDARGRLPRTEVGPDAFLAAAIAETALRGAAATVTRMAGRSRHFVFDILLTDGRRAVVRLGLPAHRAALGDAARWSDRLRPLGVPLPRILARDLTSEFPSLILEHLAGAPLLDLVDRLARPHLGRIAGVLADLQHRIRALESTNRYSSATPSDAGVHGRWSDALAAELAAARRTIRAAGLFDEALIDPIEQHVTRLAKGLDATPAEAFLAEPVTSTAMVTEAGTLNGLVAIDRLGWGDPRVQIARCWFDLVLHQKPATLAEAWLALAGARADQAFWLYAAIAGIGVIAALDQAPQGHRIEDRDRAERILATLQARLDRP